MVYEKENNLLYAISQLGEDLRAMNYNYQSALKKIADLEKENAKLKSQCDSAFLIDKDKNV